MCLAGPPPARQAVHRQLAGQGWTSWSLAERLGQLTWAFLCGCGQPDGPLGALVEDEALRHELAGQLLAWSEQRNLSHGEVPSPADYRHVHDLLEAAAPGCLEAELLERVARARRPRNLIDIPPQAASAQRMLNAGAQLRWVGQSPAPAELEPYLSEASAPAARR